MYKFCNILILLVDTSSTNRQHPVVLVNIEDSKIASEFISFRNELLNVASSMELLCDFQISCGVSELI